MASKIKIPTVISSHPYLSAGLLLIPVYFYGSAVIDKTAVKEANKHLDTFKNNIVNLLLANPYAASLLSYSTNLNLWNSISESSRALFLSAKNSISFSMEKIINPIIPIFNNLYSSYIEHLLSSSTYLKIWADISTPIASTVSSVNNVILSVTGSATNAFHDLMSKMQATPYGSILLSPSKMASSIDAFISPAKPYVTSFLEFIDPYKSCILSFASGIAAKTAYDSRSYITSKAKDCASKAKNSLEECSNSFSKKTPLERESNSTYSYKFNDQKHYPNRTQSRYSGIY